MLSRARSARGLTLIEIVVVLTVIAAMSAMATGLFPGVIQFFRARRTMEVMMWDLRKVQQRARSRGHALNSTNPSIFGVKFYQGQVIAQGGGVLGTSPDGYSYLPYGPALAEPAAAKLDIASLTQAERARVVNVDLSLIPIAADTPATVVGAAATVPERIQFQPDIAGGRADVVPDGGNPMTFPNNFLNFRLQNDDGYFRISFDNQRFIGLRYIKL